jgi:tetratricopeptide (TPR) repeat protein
MPEAPEVARLVTALQAAQSVGAGADHASAAVALQELDVAWEACPPDSLDAFDRANIQLSRSTLQQLLDLDGSESIGEALFLARQLGPETQDQRLLVQVLLEAGNSARQAGDFDASRSMIDEAIELAHTTLGPLSEETAQAHNCLGIWGRYRGEFDIARRAYTTARQIAELAPHPQMLPSILHNVASLEHLAGRPELALELIESGLDLRPGDAAERDADDAVRAAILIDLARYPEADTLFRSLTTRLGRRWGPDSTEMMHLNANWAVLEQQRGNLAAAQNRYAQALDTAERLGEQGRPEIAAIYANAAHLALTCADRDTAAAYTQRALLGLEGRVAEDLPSMRLVRQVHDALNP